MKLDKTRLKNRKKNAQKTGKKKKNNNKQTNKTIVFLSLVFSSFRFFLSFFPLSMDFDNDIIDISNHDFSSSSGPSSSSGNFGSGIELLMNEKRSINFDTRPRNHSIDDITKLDGEFNLGGNDDNYSVGSNNVRFNEEPSISFLDSNNNQDGDLELNFDLESDLGHATSETSNNDGAKTWDGYGKVNMNASTLPGGAAANRPAPMTREAMARRKFQLLRDFEKWEKRGITISKKYSYDSDLSEMESEHEMIKEDLETAASVKMQGQFLTTAINTLEFLNGETNLFDLKLEGWSDAVSENLDSYEDIFTELHIRYGKSKILKSPILNLLFKTATSAAIVHFTNTQLRTAMPGVDEIFRQNPELMHQFQTATVNTMANNNPGIGGFMKNIVQQNNMFSGPSSGPSASSSMPPTHHEPQMPNAQYSSNFARRPDLNYAATGQQQQQQQQQPPQKQARHEMNGPSDISHILSGIKTKTINLPTEDINVTNSSTISIDDMNNMTKSIPNGRKRKNKSNTSISLDI